MDLLDQLISVLEGMTSTVPSSPEAPQDAPAARAQELVRAAASHAGATAGALALPPGPLGMLTVIPDLVAVWHIQRQLVADVAACYGKTAELQREAMVYCLFRHATAQVVPGLAVRLGTRLLLRRASVQTMERSLQRIGVAVSQRALGRSISRWVPLAGAVGVGAYAFYDTMQVGRTAMELFEGEVFTDTATPAPAPQRLRGASVSGGSDDRDQRQPVD
jgi:hypothetical protein